MGVGAIFVSTLALTRLPEPHSPPRDQTEVLAATLQIIVSFVVLGSILIRMYSSVYMSCHHADEQPPDGLSIPFFSVSRRIHSRTVSVTRTWTSRTTAVPDWLLGARRMPPPDAMSTVAESIVTPNPDIESQILLSGINGDGDANKANVKPAADVDVFVEDRL